MGLFNFIKARKKVVKEPIEVPANSVKGLADPKKKAEASAKIIKRASLWDSSQLASIVANALSTSYYRRNLYREAELATEHEYVSGALNLYVDSVSKISQTTDKAVWIEAKDGKVANILNQFLEDIGIHEKIRDWAYQLGQYGDLFIEVFGQPGIGVAYIDDNIHPSSIERIDINGRLEGFIRTDKNYAFSKDIYSLLPPWQFVHFRIFGAQKKIANAALGIFGQNGDRYTVQLQDNVDNKWKITTRYGVSLLVDAIAPYKRLKLAEDTLLLARITRSILYYLYKIKITGEEAGNFDSMMDLVDSYADLLKRKTGLDTGAAKTWKDNWQALFAQVEDLFVPETDTVSVDFDKLGGEVDIKSIVDIEMFENRLLGALRVSKAQLGITDELPSVLGGEGSLRRISINFAKSADRLQSGLKNGIKRLCQIHLAYRGIYVLPHMFNVAMSPVSTAEDEEAKQALNDSIDIADKLLDLIDKVKNDPQKKKILSVLNQQFLKLNNKAMDDILSQTVSTIQDTDLLQPLLSPKGVMKVRLDESKKEKMDIVPILEWKPKTIKFNKETQS